MSAHGCYRGLMENLRALLDREFLGNSVLAWLIATGIFLGGALVLRLVLSVLASRATALGERYQRPVLRFVGGLFRATKLFFIFGVALLAALVVLELTPGTSRIIERLVILALIVQAAIWAGGLLEFAIDRWIMSDEKAEPEEVMVGNTIRFLGRVAIWAIAVLSVLDNFGVDVTTLIAGLGVGGIAVALAVQNILGDLFGSLSIVLDKPFVVGDFIVVGDMMGTVEQVGLKTTRVKSLSGEQLVFSNSDLLSSRIRNYRQMQERRVVFTVGILYESSRGQIDLVPELIRQAIQAEDLTRFDRSHFFRYGASSLDFETVYFVLSPDYNVFMDIQQRILLRIFERFSAEGIGFAYPTQTLYLNTSGAREEARSAS